MATQQEKLNFLRDARGYYIVLHTEGFYGSDEHPDDDQAYEINEFDINELKKEDTYITFYYEGDQRVSRDIATIQDFNKAVDCFYEDEKHFLSTMEENFND